MCLLERYNCLGGLSTGGLVMWIDRMTDWQGQHEGWEVGRHRCEIHDSSQVSL